MGVIAGIAALIGSESHKTPINSQCASIANSFSWKLQLNDRGTIILVKWQTAKQISWSMKAFLIDFVCRMRGRGAVCVFRCSCMFCSVTGLLLAGCVFNTRCLSSWCKTMQTVSSIPLRLSLMSLIGWSWHTPGSPGPSLGPGGWEHNVHNPHRHQICFCLHSMKQRPLKGIAAIFANAPSCQDLDQYYYTTKYEASVAWHSDWEGGNLAWVCLNQIGRTTPVKNYF